MINTVRGPIQSEQLGRTLPHEHVYAHWDGTMLDSRLDVDLVEIEETALGALRRVKARGVDTFVDMTTIDMGRNPEMLRRLSEGADINIVCCTGLFADKYGIPFYFRDLPEDSVTDLLVTEIEQGIGRTGIRAGVIKVATGEREVTPMEEKFLRAAGRAQVATGVPILTHTGYGAGGERQIEVLAQLGVAPDKIVVGHSDVSANIKYHLRLLRKGVFVGFDRIGLEAFMPDLVRAGCIATLVRMGYVDQLTMSLDARVRWIGRPIEIAEEDREYTRLQDDFLPMLADAGVSEPDVDHIMIDNIRRLFA